MAKVLISGISGFIGSNLAPKLVASNHEVWGLVRNVSNRRYVPPEGVNVVFGDLTDPFFLNKTIKELKPEIVLHLGAQSSVSYGHSHSIENIQINFEGTVNLAEANKQNNTNLERFIYAGTSEEYGNQEVLPIRESAPLHPNQPYAICKVASDYYLNYLKRQGFPCIVARPFNTYGRTDNFAFLTESAIYQFLTKDKVILGDPTPERDFLYVSDHVQAYVDLVEKDYDIFGVDTLNFCTGVCWSIRKWVEIIKELTESKKEIVWAGKRPTEISKLVGSNALAWKVLKWEPQVDAYSGLSMTIEAIKRKLNCA
jgi:nucleoside-diphosphate-sugar epimerase